MVDLDARREERDFRKFNRIAAARSILANPVGGDSGKGQALTLLDQYGLSLSSIDLSCEAMRLGRNADGSCDPALRLSGVKIESRGRSGPTFSDQPFQIHRLNLSGAEVPGIRLRDVHLGDSSFKFVRTDGGVFIKVIFWGGGDSTQPPISCRKCIFVDSAIPNYGWVHAEYAYIFGGSVLVKNSEYENWRLERGEQKTPHKAPKISLDHVPQIEFRKINDDTVDLVMSMFEYCRNSDLAKPSTIAELSELDSPRINLLVTIELARCKSWSAIKEENHLREAVLSKVRLIDPISRARIPLKSE